MRLRSVLYAAFALNFNSSYFCKDIWLHSGVSNSKSSSWRSFSSSLNFNWQDFLGMIYH